MIKCDIFQLKIVLTIEVRFFLTVTLQRNVFYPNNNSRDMVIII